MSLRNPAVFLARPLPAVLLILLVGCIAYANSFEVPFVLDDKRSIVESGGFSSFEEFSFSQTRVVAYLTFALNYRLGGLDVTGYHVVNLVVHLAAGLLVFALLRLTLQTPFFTQQSAVSPQPSALSTQHSALVPLFVALLFVVHPVQTQAVTYVVQRMTSMASMFYLLSLVLYVLGRLSIEAQGPRGKGQEKEASAPVTANVAPWTLGLAPVFLAASVLAAVLAMKTKEIAFTLPFAVLLYEVFFFQGAWKRRLLCLLPIFATLPIVPLAVLATADSSGDVLADVSEQTRASSLSRTDYLFTQFRVIVTYLRLLIFPVNQNLDYDYPIYRTFWSLPVVFSFLLLAALLVLALYLFLRTGRFRCSALSGQHSTPAPSTVNRQPSTRSDEPALRLFSFGIFWFFLALAVESSIVPIVDVIFEHRLYLPSVGAITAFVALLFYAATRIPRAWGPALPIPVLGLLVLVLAVATFQRNHVWGDDVRLWLDTAAKSPEKGRPFNELGVALEESGRREEAMESFSLAIDLDPSHFKARYNLADLLLISGRPEESLPLLAEAIRIKPDFSEAYVKAGAALLRARRYGDVVAFLEQNLDRIGDNGEARFYIGAAHAFMGNKEAARRELAVVARLDPALARDLQGLIGF